MPREKITGGETLWLYFITLAPEEYTAVEEIVKYRIPAAQSREATDRSWLFVARARFVLPRVLFEVASPFLTPAGELCDGRSGASELRASSQPQPRIVPCLVHFS